MREIVSAIGERSLIGQVTFPLFSRNTYRLSLLAPAPKGSLLLTEILFSVYTSRKRRFINTPSNRRCNGRSMPGNECISFIRPEKRRMREERERMTSEDRPNISSRSPWV